MNLALKGFALLLGVISDPQVFREFAWGSSDETE
jgi:hypothetical protein